MYKVRVVTGDNKVMRRVKTVGNISIFFSVGGYDKLFVFKYPITVLFMYTCIIGV